MQTLRLFVDVARCHSFSQAAELHGITQSAVSQRIGQLERHLGVTLLDRSVRPLAVTDAGRLFVDGCEDLLDRYDRLERKVSAPRDAPEGVVRVAAIYSAGIDLLHHVSERCEANYPQITIETRYHHPEQVYEAVHDGECDLGIVSYPQRWARRSGMGIVPLRDEVMAVVCRPDHALASREQIHARELSGHAMATFDLELPAGRRIRQYLREHDAAPRILNMFDNIDTIKSAVAVTEQCSILPRRTVSRELAAGTLKVVPLEPRLVRPMGILFRRRSRAAEAVSCFAPGPKAFVDLLLDHAGPGEEPVEARAAMAPSMAGATS